MPKFSCRIIFISSISFWLDCCHLLAEFLMCSYMLSIFSIWSSNILIIIVIYNVWYLEHLGVWLFYLFYLLTVHDFFPPWFYVYLIIFYRMPDTACRRIESKLNSVLTWKGASLIFSQVVSVGFWVSLVCIWVEFEVCCCYRCFQCGTVFHSWAPAMLCVVWVWFSLAIPTLPWPFSRQCYVWSIRGLSFHVFALPLWKLNAYNPVWALGRASRRRVLRHS